MADDASTTVALPEVPLLAVLPGTGGLTRLVDKRQRATGPRGLLLHARGGHQGPAGGGVAAGGRGGAALAAGGDESPSRGERGRAQRPAARTPAASRCRRSSGASTGDRIAYRHVTCALDRGARRRRDHRDARRAAPAPAGLDGIHAQGAAFWPLALARELDDLILHLRTNEEELGAVGAANRRRTPDAGRGPRPAAPRSSERTGWCARSGSISSRAFKRLDVTSRSLFALIEPGSCFAGTLLELALACDRSYMLDGAREGDDRPARRRASHRDESRRLSHGQRPRAGWPAASSKSPRAPMISRGASARISTRRRRWKPVW